MRDLNFCKAARADGGVAVWICDDVNIAVFVRNAVIRGSILTDEHRDSAARKPSGPEILSACGTGASCSPFWFYAFVVQIPSGIAAVGFAREDQEISAELIFEIALQRGLYHAGPWYCWQPIDQIIHHPAAPLKVVLKVEDYATGFRL